MTQRKERLTLPDLEPCQEERECLRRLRETADQLRKIANGEARPRRPQLAVVRETLVRHKSQGEV